MARKIYHTTPERERNDKKKQLAKILSVSERTIRDWLSRIDKDSKEARDKRIFEMWMACSTQEEIAAEVNCDQKTVANVVSGETADLPNFLKSKPAAEHLTDFGIPLYNIWKFKEKSNDVSRHRYTPEFIHLFIFQGRRKVLLESDEYPTIQRPHPGCNLRMKPDIAFKSFLSTACPSSGRSGQVARERDSWLSVR